MPDNNHNNAADAAVNIQRTWRGHHDRQAVEKKRAQREKERKEYFDRANRLEALLLIQTRARIWIAQTRRRLREQTIIRAAHVQDAHQAAEKAALVEKSATNIQRTWRGHQGRERVKKISSEREKKRKEIVERANMLEALLVIQTRVRIFLAKCRKDILLRNRDEVKISPSAKERELAAQKAATDIQRIWHGHEARKTAKQRAAERKNKMQQHFAEANRLEALLLIQTRVRVWLAQTRRRLREQAILRAGHLKDVHEAARKAAEYEKSATDIQRSWRGHQGRKRVKIIHDQREKARQEYFDRANLLEAVLTIQTRARIMIARSRRRIYERTVKQISPARHLIDAEKAATDVQRVWRGHYERNTKSAAKREEQNKKRNEYFERANLLESVLVIQTRMRVFRARLQLKRLKAQKHSGNTEKLKIEVGGSSRNSNSNGTSSPTNVPRPPASPPTAANSRGYTLLGGNRNGKQQQHQQQHSPTVANPHHQQQQHNDQRRNSAPSSSFEDDRDHHQKDEANDPKQKLVMMSESAKLPMYRVPPVSRSGFFVRSFEENVANNVYQGMMMNTNNNNNGQQQQGNNNSSNNNNTSKSESYNNSQNGSARSPVEGTPQHQHSRQVRSRVVINEQPKSSHVLDSPDAIRNFVLEQQQKSSTDGGSNDNNKIPKQTALHALFDVVESAKLPAIVEVWDTVTPFATTECLSVDQMILILEQIRAIKIVTETKKSLEKAERLK
jgi:hypothetical protein